MKVKVSIDGKFDSKWKTVKTFEFTSPVPWDLPPDQEFKYRIRVFFGTITIIGRLRFEKVS